MPVTQPRPVSLDHAPLRIGLFGPSGGGKTHFMMSIPGLTVIDIERSADAFARQFPGARTIDVHDPQEIVEAFKAVIHGRPGFESKALGLDSITSYRRILQADPARKKKGEYKDSDVNEAIRTLLGMLFAGCSIPVVVAAHEKCAYTDLEKKLPSHEGMIPDSDPRFPYAFDLLARVCPQSGRHGAVVVKSRFGDAIPVGRFLADFSYSYILKALGRSAAVASAPLSAPAAAPTVPPPAAAHAPGAAPAGAAQHPDNHDALKRLADCYRAAGSPNGRFVAWLRANNYPTAAADLMADREICVRIYKALTDLARAARQVEQAS